MSPAGCETGCNHRREELNLDWDHTADSFCLLVVVNEGLSIDVVSCAVSIR
jgi:hypothetical protein